MSSTSTASSLTRPGLMRLGLIPLGQPFSDTRVNVHTIVAPVSEASPASALSGVRILDFTRLGFGAQATLICGCLGAEVIRVESTRFPDAIRVMPPFVPEPGERGEA